MNILLVVLGFILLVVGGEYLVKSSVALSFKLNLSRIVIGMTVVSFATSLPELLVSLQAAIEGYSDIALGNVVGSNIANIGLVLGITALISPLGIGKDFYKLDWPIMMFLSGMSFFFLRTNTRLSAGEGGVLLFILIIYLIVIIKYSNKHRQEEVNEVDDSLRATSNFKIVVWLLIGGVSLYFGSEWLVTGAKNIAESVGISQRIISVTMVAVGTSIPELAASVIAALKKEKAISLGNLIGSNAFNIGSVLGLTAIVQPIEVKDTQLITNDIFWMLAFAFVLLPMIFLPKKMELGKLKGGLLFIGYLFFIYTTLLK